jgi:flavorubredoxin
MADYNPEEAVLVRGTDDIYWVGFADEKAGFSNNPYLIVDKDEAILIDPGSRLPEHYNTVKRKVESVIDLKKIKYMIVNHQDPDLCASLPLFAEEADPNVKIISQLRTSLFLPYYGVTSEIIPVEDGDTLTLQSGRVLTFITTPYVHFAGSMVVYDEKTKTLFSSDIFAAFSINWTLYADESEYYIEAFKAFTEPYIGCKKPLLSALEKTSKVPIERICPQHGSIIDKDIDKYLEAAKNLEVGVWL